MKLYFFLKTLFESFSSFLLRSQFILLSFLVYSSMALCKTVATSPGSPKEVKILILGDSLTEGLGVAKESAYPAILEKMLNDGLRRDKVQWKVINSGISGSTTSSATGRLKWILSNKDSKPDWVILALGANDGLRGFDQTETEKNLSEAVEKIQKEKIKVILAGMNMPPNYGQKYTEAYRKTFSLVAKKYKIPLIPFLLENVAGQPGLNQADGIHPNEKGHKIIAETVFKKLKGLL